MSNHSHQPESTKATPGSYLALFTQGRTLLSLSILLSVSLVALDVLIVNTVLPTILRQLGGIHLYAWAIGIYSLGNFMTIPIFSTLSAKIGTRRSFTMAMAIFLLGATLAALATQMHWVVLGRLLQGLGAGGFFAIPFAIIERQYPSQLQPRAIGLVSAVWALAAIGGPLLGAAILKIAGWQWVFWFNLPVGGVILILGLWALRKEATPPEPKLRLNLVGPLLFALGTALLLEGLSRPAPTNLIFFGIAVLLFGGFFFHEKWHHAPIIPWDAWKIHRPLGVAFMGMALSTAAFGGAETYLPLLLQGLWQSTPLEAGLILTIGSLSWSTTSVWIARFADRPRRLALGGSLFLLLGFILLTLTVAFHYNLYGIYLGWFIAGVGMGQAVPTYNTLSIDQAHHYSKGASTGSVLLALTWGFALGPPLAGVFARYGFQAGFNPRHIGLEKLSLQSSEALQHGGTYALMAAGILLVLAIFTAAKMPKQRIHT